MTDVTDIIVARAQQPEALKTMVVWSVTAHVILIGVLLFAPTGRVSEAPRTVMTISLGGAPGVDAGGMTQAGGRAVQEVKPPEPVRRNESAPAPTRPAMTLPDPKARVRPSPKPEQAPKESTARTPAFGAEIQEGSTRANTGAKGQGFGLSTGGNAGDAMALDVGDFCCPEYLQLMKSAITSNWDQRQGIVASTVMKFTIQRDGTLQGVLVEKGSGFAALDNAAQRALLLTKLTPLPQAFPNPTLTVHLRFDYQR